MPRGCLVIGFTFLALFALSSARGAGADSSVDDAKRKLAGQMMAESHYKDAEALLKEVVAHDATQFKDHLALGQIYDKLQDTEHAAAEYRVVVSLVPDHSSNREAFRARTLAEGRLKSLDAMTDKLDSALEDMGRKLDALTREAVQQRNNSALARLAPIRAALWKSQKPGRRFVVEIMANKEWQDSGVKFVTGRKYRIAGLGVWSIGSGVECSADGVAGKSSSVGPFGALILDLHGSVYAMGSQIEYTAPAEGQALFACNLGPVMSAGRAEASGSMYVLIEAE